MRIPFALALLALALQPEPALSQGLAPGKYSGQIEFPGPAGRPVRGTVTFTIEKVDGNEVHGVAWVGTPLCSVDTPVKGTLEGDLLKVRGTPLKERCGILWELKVAGSKLEGKTGAGVPLVLSR